jgi:putative intracellular protease/amidase
VYRDEGVVLDGNLLTGRGRDDLPTFAQHLVQLVSPCLT